MKEFEPKDIDAKLSTASQAGIRDLVKSLPEDEVSWAWRSSLNEKLIAMSPRKRFNWNWVVRPALGLGLAGALALVFISQPGSGGPAPTVGVRSQGNLEARLMADHEQSLELYDLSGPGLAPDETTYVTPAYLGDSDDLEYEIGSL